MRTASLTLALLGACSISLNAGAADGFDQVALLSYASESDFMAPTAAKVLSGSRLAQSQRDAPAMVTVIDRDMIEASGMTEVADLMELIPGFVTTHSHGWWPVVGFHVPLSPVYGSYSSRPYEYNARLQVLIDGRSVFSPSLGHVYWRAIPVALEDIERIEVVHGPNAASYGSNAFEGIVNIITRRGALDAGGRVIFRRGDRDLKNYSVSHSGEYGDLGWRITASDRWETRYLGYPDEAHDTFANARFDYRLGAQEELSLFFGVDDARWKDGDDTQGAWEPPHSRKLTDGFIQGRWVRLSSGGGEYRLQYSLYRQHQENAWTVVPVLHFGKDIDFNQNFVTSRQQLEFQAIQTPSNNLRLVWGGEYRYEEAESEIYFPRTGKVDGSIWHLFGTAEWRPKERWLINAGGMAERHYYGDTFSPRLSVHFSPSDHHSYRAAVTRGYRMPSFYEREGQAQYVIDRGTLIESYPNPGLKPERIVSTELGYVGRFPQYGASVSARVFQDRLRNEILTSYLYCDTNQTESCDLGIPLPDDYDTRYFDNAGSTNAHGAELETQWRPTPNVRLWMGLFWMQTASHFPVSTETEEVTAGRVDSWRNGVSLLGEWHPRRDWRVSALYRHVGWSSNTGFDDIDRVDVSLARKWRWGPHRLETTVTVQNLGPAYQDILVTEDKARYFERRALLTLRLDY